MDPWLTPHWKIRESISRAEVHDFEGRRGRVHYMEKLLNVMREAEQSWKKMTYPIFWRVSALPDGLKLFFVLVILSSK